MSTSAQAQIQIEQGQNLVDYVSLTDSGDHQYYTSADGVWSGKSGFAPVIRPNGIVTGTALGSAAASGTDDLVDVAAFTAYSTGVLLTISAATDETITRGATANIGKISSVTVTSAGAIAIIAGTDSADATVNDTRGSAGGPPYIPVDDIELFQVRFSGTGAGTSAAVTADQIFQVAGQHAEYSAFPTFSNNNTGKGLNAEVSAETNAFVKMAAVLPLSHTGGVSKRVYCRYYTPIFAAESRTLDYVPAETSHSVASTEYYDGTIGSSSSSLGQGSFTALLTDGITDGLNKNKNQTLTVKFFQDKNQSAYEITQGRIGISRTFPVGDQVNASVTVSAENATASFSG